MRPLLFFHLWAGDDLHPSAWEAGTYELFCALDCAAFHGDVFVGLQGAEEQRNRARNWLTDTWPSHRVLTESEEGFEMPTLHALRGHIHTRHPIVPDETPVCYVHTKGAFQDHGTNRNWRRDMTSLLVTDWETRVRDLRSHDLVAVHWLTPEEFPECVKTPMAAGNFWWATARYLRTLPPLDGPWTSRYMAEAWVGQGSPSVVSLRDGWPSYGDDGGYDSVAGGRLDMYSAKE